VLKYQKERQMLIEMEGQEEHEYQRPSRTGGTVRLLQKSRVIASDWCAKKPIRISVKF
jgi:hypothetical protein